MQNNQKIDIDYIRKQALKNNARIDKITTEEIRQEEKNKSAQERLRKALDTYCSTYKVALKVDSIEELLAFFEERARVLGTQQQKEVEKQTQAIKLYEEGNIAALNKLMGIPTTRPEYKYDNTDILGEPEAKPVPKTEAKTVKNIKPVTVKVPKPADPEDEIDEFFDEEDEESFNTTGINIADLLNEEDLAQTSKPKPVFEDDEQDWF